MTARDTLEMAGELDDADEIIDAQAVLEAERNAAQAETKRTLETFGVINDGLLAEVQRLTAENARLHNIATAADNFVRNGAPEECGELWRVLKATLALAGGDAG